MLRLIKQARAAVSMLNPGEVRKRAGRRLHIGLVASGEEAYAAMEEILVPPGVSRQAQGNGVCVHRADDPNPPSEVDLVFYEKGVPPGDGAYTLDPGDPCSSLGQILEDREELGLPLARQFPAFRKCVVDRIVHTVARENALFAIATSLPNVVPNLIELPWAVGEFASDTVFLTANQIRMAFLIAGACGKPIGFAQQRGEVLSIVAGAFGWRAIARELVGKIPLGGGLIPKGGIAFAGTFAVGKGLQYYHHAGVQHTAEESEDVYRHAFERGREVAASLSGAPPPESAVN